MKTQTPCNEKLHKHMKNLQNISHYVLESQISKKGLEITKLEFYTQSMN